MKNLPTLFCLVLLPAFGFAQYPDVHGYEDLDEPYEDVPFWIEIGGGYANALKAPALYQPTDILSGYYLSGGTVNIGLEVDITESNFLLLAQVGIIIDPRAFNRDEPLKLAIEEAYPEMIVLNTTIQTITDEENRNTQSGVGMFQFGVGYQRKQQRVTLSGNISVLFYSVSALESFSNLKERNSNKFYELTYEYDDEEWFNAAGPSIGAKVDYRINDYLRIYGAAQYGWLFYNFQFYEGLYDVYEQTYSEYELSYSGTINTYYIHGGIGISLF